MKPMEEQVKRRKAVTMQDIADLFGISKVTVSKALNNKEGIGDDLRQKIIETAEEMGYQFPQSSPSSSKGTPQNIAVFLHHKHFTEDINGYFYGKMCQLLSRDLSERGYGVSLVAVDEQNYEQELSRVGGKPHLVGIIVVGRMEEEFLSSLRTVPMPLVFLDYQDEPSESASVISENIYSTYTITNHLIEQGHRSIGYVGSIHVTPSILDRYLGYQRALLEHNLPLKHEWIIPDRDSHNRAIPLILPEEIPTAFVCNCDESAYRFIPTLREQGYRVPEDVSIVSFDNDIYSELCTPKLTTVAVDIGELARMTAYRIDKQVQQGVLREEKVSRVHGKIIYRDSVTKRE